MFTNSPTSPSPYTKVKFPPFLHASPQNNKIHPNKLPFFFFFFRSHFIQNSTQFNPPLFSPQNKSNAISSLNSQLSTLNTTCPYLYHLSNFGFIKGGYYLFLPRSIDCNILHRRREETRGANGINSQMMMIVYLSYSILYSNFLSRLSPRYHILPKKLHPSVVQNPEYIHRYQFIRFGYPFHPCYPVPPQCMMTAT